MTSFGNVKYWDVFLWVRNAPKAQRLDRGGRGRAILIAYLPTVTSHAVLHVIFIITYCLHQVTGLKSDSKSKLAQHRVEVYHKALDIVFDDVKSAAKHGMVMKILGKYRKGMPIFATISADYEEM